MNELRIELADNRRGAFSRLRRFVTKPWQQKLGSFYFRWVRLLPGIPIPLRLPFGVWWLARNDFFGAALFSGGFENPERSFVEDFLEPGMTVLDIGAHHGFYTMLASRKVGPGGRVIAFEPSPRERKRLVQHLWLNCCRNVELADCALGETVGEAELFLVLGNETGCNSLRKPDIAQPTEIVRVSMARLDDVLKSRGVWRVDFLKIDVEGAELSVFRGAPQLLARKPRPIILAEVYDIRTRPWGYRAREILCDLEKLGFEWYCFLGPQKLGAIRGDEINDCGGNFVAVPAEQAEKFRNRFRTRQEQAGNRG